jgi:hypothetical protein
MPLTLEAPHSALLPCSDSLPALEMNEEEVVERIIIPVIEIG